MILFFLKLACDCYKSLLNHIRFWSQAAHFRDLLTRVPNFKKIYKLQVVIPDKKSFQQLLQTLY